MHYWLGTDEPCQQEIGLPNFGNFPNIPKFFRNPCWKIPGIKREYSERESYNWKSYKWNPTSANSWKPMILGKSFILTLARAQYLTKLLHIQQLPNTVTMCYDVKQIWASIQSLLITWGVECKYREGKCARVWKEDRTDLIIPERDAMSEMRVRETIIFYPYAQ